LAKLLLGLLTVVQDTCRMCALWLDWRASVWTWKPWLGLRTQESRRGFNTSLQAEAAGGIGGCMYYESMDLDCVVRVVSTWNTFLGDVQAVPLVPRKQRLLREQQANPKATSTKHGIWRRSPCQRTYQYEW